MQFSCSSTITRAGIGVLLGAVLLSHPVRAPRAYADPDQHRVIVGLATTSALVTTWWHPERALDLLNNIGATAGANVYYQSHVWSGSGGMIGVVEDYPGVCTGLYLHLYDAGFNSLGHLRYTHISPSRPEGTWWGVAGSGWTIQHVGTVLADENETCKAQGLWTNVYLHEGADNSGTQIQNNTNLEGYVAGVGHPNVIEPTGDYSYQWMYTTTLIDSDGDQCSDQEELGPDPHLGGQRDPHNPYDFASVPPQRHGTAAMGGNRGQSGQRLRRHLRYQLQWHEGRCRPEQQGLLLRQRPEQQRQEGRRRVRGGNGQASGAINVYDVTAVIAQVGDTCSAPP